MPSVSSVIEHLLSRDGPIARALGDDFEPRPEQVEMAAAVAHTLEHRSHLLVEAGTGVGKSLAYLVPAVLRCLNHDETVVVATNTISLQEQLIEKDIPLLLRTIPPPPPPPPPDMIPRPRRTRPIPNRRGPGRFGRSSSRVAATT